MNDPSQTSNERATMVASRLARLRKYVATELEQLENEVRELQKDDPWVSAKDRPAGLSPGEFRARAKRGDFQSVRGPRGRITARLSDVINSLRPKQTAPNPPPAAGAEPDFHAMLRRAGLHPRDD